MKKTYPILVFVLSILFSGCSLFVKDVEIPTYLKIDSFSFETNYSSEGSNSSKITDAWIYVDDQLQGIYELPVEFPVIATEGQHIVKVLPGIKLNGIAATRVAYPLYQHYAETLNFVANTTIEIAPSTQYMPNANFKWMEDFETSFASWEADDSSDTTMLRTTNSSLVFEGTGSGKIIMDENISFFEIESKDPFALPKDGSPIFLELDYFVENLDEVGEELELRLAIGMIGYETQNIVQNEPILWLNPTEGWNKIYINLTTSVTGHSAALAYGLYFGSVRNEGASTGNIYIDNIKLVFLE